MKNKILQTYFSDSINIYSVKNFIFNLKKICTEHPKEKKLAINISSPGGEVDIAIELFYFLRNLDCEIHTINTSYVNSAAIIVYLAGDIRICHSGSTFFIHSISKRLKGSYNIQSLTRELKEIKTNTDTVTKILEQRTVRSKRYWKSLMNKGDILNAKQAMKTGLASTFIDK